MVQYIDSHVDVTEASPVSPNALALGITAILNIDRCIAAMTSLLEHVF